MMRFGGQFSEVPILFAMGRNMALDELYALTVGMY